MLLEGTENANSVWMGRRQGHQEALVGVCRTAFEFREARACAIIMIIQGQPCDPLNLRGHMAVNEAKALACRAEPLLAVRGLDRDIGFAVEGEEGLRSDR